MLQIKALAFIALASLVVLVSLQQASLAGQEPRALRLCVACHTFGKGQKAKIGPNLYGIYGKAAAENPTYKRYGESLKTAAKQGLIWNQNTLDAYITNPITFLKKQTNSKRVKTSMISRVKKEADRKAIVEYLKNLKD